MAENVGRFVAVQRSCRYMHLEKGQKAYNSIFFPPLRGKRKMLRFVNGKIDFCELI